MLGFDLDLWDYITFAALFILAVGALMASFLYLDLPGESRLPASIRTLKQSILWVGSGFSPLCLGFKHSYGLLSLRRSSTFDGIRMPSKQR